jgi:DNA-binding transcriptional LysR family regulator
VDVQISDRIGRRIKLHDLHVLMAVVQAGSMSRAAQILNTTQSAVSRSVADLEQTMGVRLLERSRRGVEPTEYGRALLSGGLAMFDELRQAVKNIEHLADPTSGEVRVGAYDPLIIGVLPAVFDRIHREYPGISIQVTQTAAGAEQFRGLRERQVDLLLGRMDAVEDDIHAEFLFHDRPKVVAGARSKWARKRKVALSELADEPWVLPPQGSAIGVLIADSFRARGVSFPPKGVMWGRLPSFARFYRADASWVSFRRRCCSSAPIFRDSRSCRSSCRFRAGRSEL